MGLILRVIGWGVFGSARTKMLEVHWKLIRWVLAGGAFVAILNAAGCVSTSNSQPAGAGANAPSIPQPPPGQTNIAMSVNPAVLSTADSGDAVSAGQPVNVYGEFGGVQRPQAKSHGNGAFEEHTYIDEGFDSDVMIDPTGKWMVFTSTRDSDHPNVYLQRVDGLSVIQLTNDEADYAFPSFSPDGKQIAFCSTRAGNWDIYTMDIDGKNIVQLTNDPMQHIHPSFSPDGSRLVYCCLGGKSGQWELWTVDLTSGQKQIIGFGLFPKWSPDRKTDRIAFQRARQRGSRWYSIWTLDLVDGEARRVTEVTASTNAALVCPSWSPDGKQIAFTTIAEPNNSTASKPLGQQDIWTINWDGSGRRRVTDGVGMNLCPSWAPDNRIYFVSDRGGAECVWSARTDQPGEPSKVAAQPDQQTDKGAAQPAIGQTE
jgi:Tol biopolymer transport system component